MRRINIFLASSNELKPERERFELEIYRKCKAWFDEGIFLHLDIWEDMSTRLSLTGSQSEYNTFVKAADLFVFLAYSKVGMYTGEEFKEAFGQFEATQRPFIFTYFKTAPDNAADSLAQFKQKLAELKHFPADFTDFDSLWNQFNKELDRLKATGFSENKRPEKNTATTNITQHADKIYNIDNIGNANFS
jgi:hypothetical protein